MENAFKQDCDDFIKQQFMTPPKLSSLSPTDKIRLAAELDGWLFRPTVNAGFFTLVSPSGQDSIIASTLDVCCIHFHYSTSYDAIIPLIQKQGMYVRAYMVEHCSLLDTPSQLLDDLLIATGKATI